MIVRFSRVTSVMLALTVILTAGTRTAMPGSATEITQNTRKALDNLRNKDEHSNRGGQVS